MLRHVVMYKLKPEANTRGQELVAKFLSMDGKIPQLKAIFAGEDTLKTPRSFDVVLICDFLNKADLDLYLDHPYHQEVRAFVLSITEKAHSVDYIM